MYMQNLNKIKLEKINKYKIYPKKKYLQNFLIEKN